MSSVPVSTAAVQPARAALRRRGHDPRWLPYALVAPAVAYLLGITLYPFIYALYKSFYQSSFTMPGMDTFVGFGNYTDLFRNGDFLASVLNTLIISGSSVLAEFVLALGLAALVYRDPWVKGWRMMFLAPMLFMPSAVSFMWKLLFVPGASVVNNLMESTGFLPQALNWVGNPTLARLSLVVADVWEWTPFLFLIFVGALQAQNSDLEEAAKVDGARNWQVFWQVSLPLLRPIIAIALVLRSIDAVTMFTKVYVMTQGAPAGDTETVSYFIYRVGFNQFDAGTAAAASVLVLIVTIAVAQYAVSRYFRPAME
ncbi:MAG: sugar ABC transporter permease [Salinisphaera sp.]|jgi:multiple sugar transport system permease protein|nr:sugar ABC transporter permease [Salinisphaera sp.]